MSLISLTLCRPNRYEYLCIRENKYMFYIYINSQYIYQKNMSSWFSTSDIVVKHEI